MVEDNGDTTDLSDDVLRNRLRVLRGEPATLLSPPIPLAPGYALPNLLADGMLALELTVTKESTYDGIRYEMQVKLTTDAARDRVLEAVRSGGSMYLPDMFPALKTDDVYVTHFDANRDAATFGATLTLEEVAAVPK